MNTNIVEKNGKIKYTNWKAVRKMGIILFVVGSFFTCFSILQFLGQIEFGDPSWAWTAKGSVSILILFLSLPCMMILQALYNFWRGKTFRVTLGPESLQYKFSDKVQDIKYREIDEVLLTDSTVQIRRKGKFLLVGIPDWFFGSQAKEFVELLKTRIGSCQTQH